MNNPQRTGNPTWRKSSFTSTNECVELAWPNGAGAVRDSKHPAPTLGLDRASLTGLITAVKTGTIRP